ncbi:Putative NADH-flavin reductase [Kingella potus]|uniref:NADH-flavin reductase n=1 Tax=Kingella potus TaxID=265175 RepID=A0A377R1X6_9NEIS|nr:NAD(P)H-binding protein [Kingella potus]UOP00432.1 NAD(P)H-binding protein [Kingella potus]STR02501.1 Putative NADH-flavin reductase [Kingella potus]
MKNILIIGANGSLARAVIAIAEQNPDLHLTLFARRLKNTAQSHRTFAGDALNVADLTAAMAGIDIVYVNLAGDLGKMGENIIAAMKAANVRRVIAVSSIGIYDEPLRPVLRPYRALADIIETSGLDYTILRPDWFTDADEVDYQLTPKGQPETGGAVSRKSIADFVCRVFDKPELWVGENLNISKV